MTFDFWCPGETTYFANAVLRSVRYLREIGGISTHTCVDVHWATPFVIFFVFVVVIVAACLLLLARTVTRALLLLLCWHLFFCVGNSFVSLVDVGVIYLSGPLSWPF